MSLDSRRLSFGERVIVRGLRLIPPGTRGKARLAKLLLPMLSERGEVIVKLAGGEHLLVPSVHEPIAFQCLIDGCYEPDLIELLRVYLPLGGVFLDIGANVGVFALAASQVVGCLGRVIAIEASPEIGKFLSHNIAVNGCRNVTLIAKAASERGPQRIAFWPAPIEKFGMGALAPQFGATAIEVDADTIDNILFALEIEHVDLIKLDIEGFEAAALRGARRLLSRKRPPAVIFEFADWAESRAGAERGDAQRVLLELGFTLNRIHPGGQLEKLSRPLVRGGANLLALPFTANNSRIASRCP